MLAFFAAGEEQGRKTLHCHWQIWVKEIDKTLRNCLFHEDYTINDIARKTFCKQIDNVISAGYGSEFRITHKCVIKKNDLVNKQDMAEVLFQEQDPYFFDVHVTKNYVQTFKEDSCHALVVEKSSLHRILSTIVFKSGKILSFQEIDCSIIDQIQLFHFPERG